MAEHIAVVDLARELRVKSAAIVKFARDEGMNLRSAAQPVSEAQAQKIRQAYSEGQAGGSARNALSCRWGEAGHP